MAKIAVLIDDFFEDSEYTRPAEAFRNAGHELIHVGVTEEKRVKGKELGTPVIIDRALSNVSPDAFDALFIPGGYSPDRLRAYPQAVELVKTFMQSHKPVFAICHGPQLLISADVLKGRRLTGWMSIIPDIKNAGGDFINEEVVTDDNLVTSRKPADIPAFIRACLQTLESLHSMEQR